MGRNQSDEMAERPQVDEREQAARPQAPTVYILGLNDFPLGVYSAPDLAEAARRIHERKHRKSLVDCGREETCVRYWVRQVELNGKAKL
jgi:hypothetical protein